MSYRITVDTGGTFTDMVVASDSGRQVIGKAPTTPERIFNGMKARRNPAAKSPRHVRLDKICGRVITC